MAHQRRSSSGDRSTLDLRDLFTPAMFDFADNTIGKHSRSEGKFGPSSGGPRPGTSSSSNGSVRSQVSQPRAHHAEPSGGAGNNNASGTSTDPRMRKVKKTATLPGLANNGPWPHEAESTRQYTTNVHPSALGIGMLRPESVPGSADTRPIHTPTVPGVIVSAEGPVTNGSRNRDSFMTSVVKGKDKTWKALRMPFCGSSKS